MSYLSFELYASEAENPEAQTDSGRDDDNYWTSTPVIDARKYVRSAGRMDTIVTSHRDAQPESVSTIPDYFDEACLAPMLLNAPPGESDSISFLPVSTTLQDEGAEDRMSRNKYRVWPCNGPSEQPCGGRFEMVGDVWAWKLYRNQLKHKQQSRKTLFIQSTPIGHLAVSK